MAQLNKKIDAKRLEYLKGKKSRKIILQQNQSPGDILTFTRALGDFKESYPDYQLDVRSPCPEIFENSTRLTKLDENADDVEIYSIGYSDINKSGWHGLHFTDAFRNDLEKQCDVKINKTGNRPELFISDEEKSWFNQVHCEFNWDGPYWIINAGRKQDNELKQYHRWPEVAKLFNERFNGKVKLVQIGHKDHLHPPLEGVLNLVGKTDPRQYIRLAYWAHGSIGPISYQMILSAAFQQSAVVVAGGKEGVLWHIYPHMRYLHTNGCMDCCAWDGCWLGGKDKQCKHLIDKVPGCFRLIEPYQIVDAVESYYKGGIIKANDYESSKPKPIRKEEKETVQHKRLFNLPSYLRLGRKRP